MEKKVTLQDEVHEEPLKNGPPRQIRPWNEDDESNYFMSEPSVSEAESSEYVRPAHIPSLLAPRPESPSDTSSKEHVQNNHEHARTPPSPPPGQQRQLPYPTSPGTSLSSWDSPHLFRKRVQLYFAPDKGSKHLEVPAARKGSNKSTSSSSTAVKKRSNDFLKQLKQQSVGAVKDARPEDFDSDRSQLNGADRQKVNAVIRNVKPRSTDDTAGIPQNESTDQDETLVMDLSTDDDDEEEEEEEVTKTTKELLDWEAKHSADDEKTAERPRRARRGQGSGHRRTRSGDAAAASLMTGGKDWKGMQIDQIPIQFEHDDEDDHDQSHDSEEVRQPTHRVQDNIVTTSKGEDSAKTTVEAGGGFAIGSGKNVRISKRPRRNLRVRRPMSWSMERMETDSAHQEERISRAVFSRHALVSPRAIPKYVGRASPTNESLSTIDHYTSERMESDSSGHGAGPPRHNRAYSDMDFRVPGGRRRTHSDADIFQPQSDHRVSEIAFDSPRGHGSPFSWFSSNNEPRLASSWDPQHDYRLNGYQFGDTPEMLNDSYQFGDAEDETPGNTGSEYDSTEEDERNIHSNRFRYDPTLQLDELERLLEDKEMRGRSQHVLRHRFLPRENEQEMVSPRTRRATYMPMSHSEGDYPTFVCPVCKTRQREFFTASSAPSQFRGPTGYLALYFAIYVIAALFIFGLEEGWQALDCVYFAVLTLTTAGLGDFVPTSDGAKIMCSIFIYFGVACIGLLLGSYLASMLDDKSYKQAQRNRVENCTNCIRLKNIEKMQLRRQKQQAAYYHKRQTSTKAQPMRGFMSERNSHDMSNPGPHSLERERRVRTQRSPNSHSPSSAAPGSSKSATRKAFNVDSPTSVPGSNEGRTAERDSDKNDSAADNQVPENKDDGGSDEVKLDEAKEVIDSYQPPSDVMMSPEATSIRLATGGSPGSMADIRGRQTHTRHMSIGGNDLDLSTSRKRTTRPRGFSADLTRPQFAETIPEDATVQNQSPKSWSHQTPTGIVESDTETDIDDESTVSETSIESDVTLDEAISRIKTAKYVFLTLKQALMNSILIILIGGLGFFTIEGMSAVDSFYFTTVLLTTVGYGDIVPVTSAGKLFATVYVLVAGTVLLHNMSLISFIPLELRKRRIEQAVLTQFGDQLDDAALRELATGPLVQNLQLSTHSATGLEECTRETFALAMLVRLGKVSETDIKQTFKAFRRLDVDDEGVLTTKSIIAGLVHKHRSIRGSNSTTPRNAGTTPGRSQPLPPPPPPFVEETEERRPSSKYWFGKHGSLHVRTEQDSYRFVGPEEYDDPPGESERSSLMRNNIGYNSFRSQQGAFGPDLEQGYYPGMYQQREEAGRHHVE